MTPDDPRTPPTGPDAPPPSLDELASALVDGQLDPDTAAAARARPDVLARAAEIEAARDLLRTIPAADAGARDRAIAAALDAFDALDAETGGETDGAGGDGHAVGAGGAAGGPQTGSSSERPPPPSSLAERGRAQGVARDAAGSGSSPDGSRAVTDLGARRAAAPSRRWLGAAAAVVLLGLVLVAGVVGNDSSDDASMEASSGMQDDAPGDASSPEDGAGAGEDSGTEEGAVDEAPADAPAGAVDPNSGLASLGSFATADDLLDTVAATLPDPAVPPEAALEPDLDDARAGTPCAGGSDDFAEPGGAIVAVAVLDGAPVEVRLIGPAQAQRLVVLDATCSTLAERPVE